MIEEPTYYGILPGNVRYDKRLKPMEKIMYTEITCLSNKYGYCFANNKYFANLYEVSKETVSRWVSNLVKCGHVSRLVKYKDNSKEVDKRYLTINPIPIDNLINGGNDLNINTSDDYKINNPIDKKVKDNTTSSNIINNNISDHFEEVWKLYPVKKGKGQISESKKKAMLKYTVEQWKVMIDRYVKSVDDPKFLKHGRTFLTGGYVDYTDENYQEQQEDIKNKEKKKYTDTTKYQFNDIEKGVVDTSGLMDIIKKGGK